MNTRKSKSYCKSLSTRAQEILSTVKIVTPTYLSSLSSPCNLFSCQLHLLTVFAPSGVKKSSEKLSTVKCRWFLRKQFSRMMGVVKESRKKKKEKKIGLSAQWTGLQIHFRGSSALFGETLQGKVYIPYHVGLLKAWKMMVPLDCHLLSVWVREGLKIAVYTKCQRGVKVKILHTNGCHEPD